MKKLFITIFLLFFVASFVWSASDERSVTVKGKKTIDTDNAIAGYYALIIGNNNYKNFLKLKTSVADAIEVEKTLKKSTVSGQNC